MSCLHLQQSHEAEKAYHQEKVKVLRKEEDTLQRKLNRLLDLYLEKGITEALYTGNQQALERQLKALRVERALHEDADEQFKNALITAFRLANRASALFESSKISEKRQLIQYVFSNLRLRGPKLDYTLRKPFDGMLDLAGCAEWLPRTGSNRRQDD